MSYKTVKGEEMKKAGRWLLVDTETTGLIQPIHAVEIAAQLMEGWKPVGEPFRQLINVDAEIPSEVSRVHGYTKEILQRDGLPPTVVHEKLYKYADGAAVCSYNLKYDYDDVLLREWRRIGIIKVLSPGFCLLRLTQRLIDPVSSGNHKLQTLRQFYRLPERGAHTALGDVQTVLDLLTTVLRPMAAEFGLQTIDQLKKFTEEIWFPTRIPFGKYRGRSYQDARQDNDFRSWIEWLSKSDNERSRSMGCWYLEQLKRPLKSSENSAKIFINATDSAQPGARRGEARMGIVIFNDAKIKQLKALVSAARERLADLEMVLDRHRAGVAKTQGELFSLLKTSYKRRDDLKLVIEYRRLFIQSLLADLDLDPADVRTQFNSSQKRLDEEFEAAEKLTEQVTSLSAEQQNEMKDLYRKLVKLYHPDLVNSDQSKSKAYTRLLAIINQAKARMDIALMREIANDPPAFMRKNNLGELQEYAEDGSENLRRLYDSLQAKILDAIASIDELRSGAQFELFRLASRRAGYINEVATQYRAEIDAECEILMAEADKLRKEIKTLQDEEAF
jgi:DNA polymerase III epsilon subunit-like protein